MNRAGPIALAALLLAAPGATAQGSRIASDFEIQQMERVAKSGDFASQLSAHLNLGMLRRTRNETDLARREFETVIQVTEAARQRARVHFDLVLYPLATLYEALAEAALDHRGRAFELAEEGVRYAPTESSWNVVANTMDAIDQPAKAIGAARNAVALGTQEVATSPSASNQLDLVVSQYTLSTSLVRAGEPGEAMPILEAAVARLRSPAFDEVRKAVASHESFEIFTTVRGDVQGYLSALQRTQLKLAALYENSGRIADARRVYRDVVVERTDDATALAALARLARDEDEQSRRLTAALDANPFSLETIRVFQQWLASRDPASIVPESGSGPGTQIRRALEQLQLGKLLAARETLTELASAYPENDVVELLLALTDIRLGDLEGARARTVHDPELSAQVAAWLRASEVTPPRWLDGSSPRADAGERDLRALLLLLADNGVTAAQRGVLDRVVLSSPVVFDAPAALSPPGKTVFATGKIGSLPITFAQPAVFTGMFAAGAPLVLEYRVLGATEVAGEQGLLLEPVRLEKQ
jgi:tetratricopeptide (TPR) repeat protein